MLAFQTVPIVNIIDKTKTCPCCKDDLDEKTDDYIKISCGHEYHYECILDAFEFNKKRGSNVLECPYCRAKVKALPIKDGYDYCNTIHGGMAFIPGISDKWNIKHKGPLYCCYNKKGLFCNGVSNTSSKYCWQHINVDPLGAGYCQFKKGDNYCNIFLSSNSSNYCYCHKSYENANKCCYVFITGKNKGSKCEKWCWPTEEEPAELCLAHLKHKDKQAKIIIEKGMGEDVTCPEILKSGAKKGQVCGVKNCKRHKSQSEVKSDLNNTDKIIPLGDDAVSNTKVISLQNINEHDVVVHVEKSNEKIEPIDKCTSPEFKLELVNLLWDTFAKVPLKNQKEIQDFIHKYNLGND